jgi:hypothetical protein
MMVGKKATLIALVMAMVISGCQSRQIIDSTKTATPVQSLTPTFTFAPTLTPTVPATATQTQTPEPTLTPSPVPSLPPGVVNLVRVSFLNTTSYDSPELIFISHEVNGVSHWAPTLQNTPDKSHAPVYALSLEFKSKMDEIGSNIMRNTLVVEDPPIYKWSFGEVPEEPVRDVYTSAAYVESADSFSNPFTPEFDASVTVDKTTFSEPGIQTITITIIPRGSINPPHITVHTRPGGDMAEVKVLDIPVGEQRSSNGEVISVSPDRENLFVAELPIKKDKPYDFTFSLQVDPHKPEIKYLPWISISYSPRVPSRGTVIKSENGMERGNTLVWDIKDVGTWTWTAVGDYKWNWQAGGAHYMVNFGSYILSE